ncbi:hypothetical protein WISP_138796 [Willisornis vidua]|uniref:Uncharacterized protein n=1 Tax=Willisornis vidua TaxID=1566151 RepID=A0ABQ9CSP7_9PASS|nr:hypothetical protein WISP_138796 [Willisornis vidua]
MPVWESWSRNDGSQDMEYRKIKEWAQGKKINYQHGTHLHFDGKDNEATNSTFFTNGNPLLQKLGKLVMESVHQPLQRLAQSPGPALTPAWVAAKLQDITILI